MADINPFVVHKDWNIGGIINCLQTLFRSPQNRGERGTKWKPARYCYLLAYILKEKWTDKKLLVNMGEILGKHILRPKIDKWY